MDAKVLLRPRSVIVLDAVNQIIFYISSRPRQPDTQITVERARKMKDSLPRTPHFRFKYKRILGAKVHKVGFVSETEDVGNSRRMRVG